MQADRLPIDYRWLKLPRLGRKRLNLEAFFVQQACAVVLAALFGGVGVAAWAGGEPFLAVMGGIGCLMTAWVGGLTLFRG